MQKTNDRILIVEDDVKLASMLVEYLSGDGFDAHAAHTAPDGLKRAQTEQFCAIILDVMLPGFDGLEFCKRLRNDFDTPIIMLTAKGDPFDRVLGLELGADDYLPKPFEPRELLARIRAVLRRGKASLEPSFVSFGRLRICEATYSVHIEDRACELTSYQFKLLQILSQNAGRVVSRDTLMHKLQGHNLDVFDRSIDVHISRIRAEIEDDPKKPRRIITLRGVGYLFTAEQD